MKRKSNPIPPGVMMLHTDPMEFYLKATTLGYHYWWNPDFKDIIELKVKCASFINYKAGQSTIDNQKRYLGHKYIRSLEMNDLRAKGGTSRYGYGNPSPFANVTPNITIQQVKNDPMTGIRVVGVSPYLGNKEEVLVVLPGDYLYTMDIIHFVEAASRGDVLNGYLQGEYIWASNGSKYHIIRKDSPYHQSLVKTEG